MDAIQAENEFHSKESNQVYLFFFLSSAESFAFLQSPSFVCLICL